MPGISRRLPAVIEFSWLVGPSKNTCRSWPFSFDVFACVSVTTVSGSFEPDEAAASEASAGKPAALKRKSRRFGIKLIIQRTLTGADLTPIVSQRRLARVSLDFAAAFGNVRKLLD